MTGLDFLYHTLPGQFLLKGIDHAAALESLRKISWMRKHLHFSSFVCKKTGIDVSNTTQKISTVLMTSFQEKF